MSKRSVLLIGPPGSGKSVAFETLKGGTVDINFDPGGWRSLDRPPISDIDRKLIESGQKRGRIPKKLKFAPTLREWLANKDNKLEADEILIIDYDPKSKQISTSKASAWSTELFLNSAQDINMLERSEAQVRGICNICCDSLTWWQWAVLGAIVLFRGGTSSGYVGTDQDIYGKAIERMKEVLDVCCHLPFNFIYTAHTQMDKDEMLGKLKEEIAIYGKKLPELIASMTDDIFFCNADMNDIKNGVPRYTWSAHPKDFMKAIRTRSFDNLPLVFDANFEKLYGERWDCQ